MEDNLLNADFRDMLSAFAERDVDDLISNERPLGRTGDLADIERLEAQE